MRKKSLATPAISVIIPVFNVEEYILRCIKSVLSQTYTNYEVLIIDDVSPCRSISLIKEYFNNRLPNNIKIIRRNENGGLGAARNTGIEAAKGDFILFLDSDDWLKNNALELFYKKSIEHNADVVVADFYMATEAIAFPANSFRSVIESTNRREFVLNYNPCAWNKLYHRSLFITNNIRFPEEKQWYEDVATIPLILSFCKTVFILKEPLFYYYQRPDSIMGQTRKGNSKLFDIFKSSQRLIKHRRYFTKQEWLNIEESLSFHCGAARLDDIAGISNIFKRFKFFNLLYKKLENTLPRWKTSAAITSYHHNYKKQHQLYLHIFTAFRKGNIFKAWFWSLFLEKRNDLKPKILFAIPTLGIGGAEKVFVNMLSQINLDLLDVTVYVYQKTGEFEKQLPANKIKVIQRNSFLHELYGMPFLPTIFSKKISIRHKLFKLKTAFLNNFIGRNYTYRTQIAKHIEPDYKYYNMAVAYTDLTPDMTDFVLKKVDSGKKMIWIHNDFNPSYIDYIDEQRFNTSFQQFDDIVCVSTGAGHSFAKRFPSTKDKIRILFNFIDVEEIKQKASVTPQNFFTPGVVNLISISRIDLNHKGYDRIIPIVVKLKQEGFRFKWHIIGDGKDYSLLNEMIMKYDIEDIIILHGSSTNPYPFLKHADALVLPSRFEAYPTVVLESHILNTPAIVAHTSGTDDQFISIQEMVLENNEASIYKGLKRYLHDAELRTKMKSDVASYEYDNDRIRSKLYKLIDVHIPAIKDDNKRHYSNKSIQVRKAETSKN